ncbi:MAPK-interacting and spindle-stabilizing protein-like isoform X2 [Dendrobates tinctorius]|uniref:MAPK-interacting and spindle-stabilizing protein-like isoform X2 n=1 Tax=Dendrobates tinctorius TaxID=92724 RepID=UPI003CC9EC68
MDKVKGVDHILVVDLSLLHQRTHTHLDLSQEPQRSHIHLVHSLEHPHNHIHLVHSLEHPPNHIHLDLSQEPQRTHIHLDLSQEPQRTHIHLVHSLEPLHNHIQLEHHRSHTHLDLSQEHQVHLQALLGLTQALHLDNSLLHQMPHILQDLLGHIQELLLDSNQLHQMHHSLHNLLALMQECPLGHNQGLPLGNILMHLGNTPQLSILQGLLAPIPIHLEHQVSLIQVLQDKVPPQEGLILLLMVSLVLQVLVRVGLGVLINGDHRVVNIQQTKICHTQPPVNFQLLVLHHLYHGVLCLLVSGGHLLHFLEPLDHTLIQDHIHEAVYPSGCLQTQKSI